MLSPAGLRSKFVPEGRFEISRSDPGLVENLLIVSDSVVGESKPNVTPAGTVMMLPLAPVEASPENRT